jgi:hypothetical protein
MDAHQGSVEMTRRTEVTGPKAGSKELVPLASPDGSGETVMVPFSIWVDRFTAEMEAWEARLQKHERRWHPLRLLGLDVGD